MIYEAAFEPHAKRIVTYDVEDQVYNVSKVDMNPTRVQACQAPRILLANKRVYHDAFPVFAKHTYADVFFGRRPWHDNDGSELDADYVGIPLGLVPACGFLAHVKEMRLLIWLDDDLSQFDDWMRKFRRLSNAVHHGRYLKKLSVRIHTDWESKNAPCEFHSRLLMAALTNSACKGDVEVE